MAAKTTPAKTTTERAPPRRTGPSKAQRKARRLAISTGVAGKAVPPKPPTIIDATGLVLGRMATFAAKQALEGHDVHIINAEKAIIVGSSKKSIQEHYLHKRQTGTARKGPFFPREPHLLVKRTCRGMINYQSGRGRAAYKRIKAHLGVPRELANEKPVPVAHAARLARTYLTVAELSSWLGRPTPQEA